VLYGKFSGGRFLEDINWIFSLRALADSHYKESYIQEIFNKPLNIETTQMIANLASQLSKNVSVHRFDPKVNIIISVISIFDGLYSVSTLCEHEF